MNSGNITAVIPAYNEENNIRRVVEEIRELGIVSKIIVVDDGSFDQTAEIVRRMDGIELISHPFNLGQWAALRTGFALALMDKSDIIVTLDSDGQHDPAYIENLVTPILDDEADIVSGSRFIENNISEMPFHRNIGISFFNQIVSLLIRTRLTDCTTGFRAMKAEYLREIMNQLQENQYGSLEFLIKISKSNTRLKEIPVPLRHSSITRKGKIRYGYNLLRTILTYP